MPIEVGVELEGVKLGVLELDGVTVSPSTGALADEILRLCEQIHRSVTVDQVSERDSVRAVRAMFRAWGIDPARYRPSSEALLRRIAQGKGLYRISNVVDAGNLGSLETGWPYGIYNRALISPPVVFRAGETSETYEGIGKQTWHLAGRPVLADKNGAFGSPISDSARTMVTEAARNLLGVIYAPAGAAPGAIESALQKLADRITQSGGGAVVRSCVVS
ncbi:MAG: phenylalanine--tRNA ligase beta subunit-related protein [Candidatus Acidiferrales bacterium]|jgi:DNA/RNA-binding domain of Phe-tRNA-synthetase-like protein